MFLTETWLNKDDETPGINEMKPPGFSVRSFPRKKSKGSGVDVVYKGGGMDVVYRTTYDITWFREFECQSFHSFQLCLTISNTPISFICVYRHTKSKMVCTDTDNISELVN